MKHFPRLVIFLVAGALLALSTPAAQAQGKGKPKKMNPIATIETNRGAIKIKLFPEDAPKAVENFIKLARKGYYDGLKWHRVEDWVVQTGDPKGDGTGGPGYTIPDETNKTLKHNLGAVGMAKSSEPNSGGSQFYIIVRKPANFLDGRYTVFGQVIQGQDVAEKLQLNDTMKKVTIAEPEAK